MNEGGWYIASNSFTREAALLKGHHQKVNDDPASDFGCTR